MPAARALVTLVASALLLGACGGDDEPAAQDWEPAWVRTVAVVPGPEEIARGGEEVCEPALGELRATREELVPAPSRTLEEQADRWLEAATGLLFDCPDDPAELDERTQELRRLRAVVDARLDAQRG